MAEIVGEFLVESYENLDQLDRDLVGLEQDPTSKDLLSSIFRTVHTIKGTSGFLAFNTLESVTHVGENLLARLREGRLTLTPALTSVLLELVDAVRAILAQIELDGTEGSETYGPLVGRLTAALTDEPAEEPAEPAEAHTEAPTEALTVPAEEPAGELGREPEEQSELVQPAEAAPIPVPVVLTAVPEPAPDPEPESHGEPEASVAATRAVPAADSTVRVDVGVLDTLMNLVGELVLTRNQMLQRSAAREEDTELARTTQRLNLVAGELQDSVMKTRMQPMDNVWNKLPRMVRDLSVSLGKVVELRLEGRDTELDKTLLEAVRDPLTHVVRNAVDHGIETPDARLAAGKPASGTLTLRAFHEGGQVNIEITDDGAGIDPQRLRDKAVERGMLTAEEARSLGDREALNLIFAPGFSTAQAVTNVSGRGVGMDVVRTNIEKIGGTVDLASETGQGTTLRIRIPLTLAIIPAVVVATADHRYAVPQVNLVEVVRVKPGHEHLLETIRGVPVHRLRGRLLPLVDMREQLGLPSVERDGTYIVVLNADDRHYGLVVDRVLDTEEIVVKPLGPQFRELDVYAGATIMGDGQVALILDAAALARRAGMVSPVQATGVVEATGTEESADLADLMLVRTALGTQAAIPLGWVDRLEKLPVELIERTAGHEVAQYRGQVLPLVRLSTLVTEAGAWGVDHGADAATSVPVVVCRGDDALVGIVVDRIVDIVQADLSVRTHVSTSTQQGSAVVGGVMTELLDIDRVVALLDPGLLTLAPAV